MSTYIETLLRTTAAGTGDRPLLVATGAVAVVERPIGRWWLVLRIALIAVVVAGVVTAAGGLVARSVAQSQALADAVARTERTAVGVAQPAVSAGLARLEPAAIERFGRRMRLSVLTSDVTRVELLTQYGQVVYADDARLVGRSTTLGTVAAGTLRNGRTAAEVDGADPFGNLVSPGVDPTLRVYSLIHGPTDAPLLLQVTYRYSDVVTKSEGLWMEFTLLIAASMLLLLLALVPLMVSLVRTTERSRQEREDALVEALGASDAERRRIAAAVHDGPVQELVGAAFQLGAASRGVAGSAAEEVLLDAEESVRATLESLRDLLVDIYPASLDDDGIGAALGSLVAGARGRGGIVLLHVDPDLQLEKAPQQLVFRVARETLANAVKHAGDSLIEVRLSKFKRRVELVVEDRGPGFDAARMLHSPPAGHFGLRLLKDAIVDSNVDSALTVHSVVGSGTTWKLLMEV